MATNQEQTTSQTPVLKTLLVSDLVDSTRLVEELGDQAAAELGQRHDRLARDLLAEHDGLEIDKTDGFLLLFDRPLDAARYALAYHRELAALGREEEAELAARVGIHLGEVFLRRNPPEDVARGAKPLEVEGLAKPTAARLMSVAGGGQTLLTRGAFDLARRAAVGAVDEELSWLAHGGYLFKGVAEPVEVFEVGREGVAPLAPPEDSAKVRRVVEQTTIPGWRPAPGLAIPHRGHWVVREKVGEGGFGEAWLAAHDKTRERRVFKFCYDAASLRSLQREITLFRLLKEELGDREDISRVVDWSFEEAPYFIESEYTEGGNLVDWAEEQGGLAEVPLARRLEIVAQVATALAAAHSVGVLHKDVKPSNVLIATGRDGEPEAQLSDFGVGAVTEAKRLADAGITVLGLTARTEMSTTPASYSGTRLYTAPEVLEGKPATLQADVYALGLMLYQMVVGDFSRALAPGWRRDVEDELLAEDIAVAVDGSPERRLGDATRLAERLRTLDSRRQEHEAERHEKEERARLAAALEKARKRRRLWAAAVIVLALFAGAMTMMMFRVRSEAQRAERMAVFLAELFEMYGTTDPGAAPGTPITTRELIDRGRDKLESSFEDDPRTRGRLTATLGDIYLSLGHYQDAESLHEEALTLRRQALGGDHRDIAFSLYGLAQSLQLEGDHEGAEPFFRESLEMKRRLLGDEHPDVAYSLLGLAWALLFKGDPEAAGPLFRESLEMSRQPGGGLPAIANSRLGLAMVLQLEGDHEAAEPLFRKSLVMNRLVGSEHLVADSLTGLAWFLVARGQVAEAEPLIDEALEIYRKTLPADNWRVSNAEIVRGSILAVHGRYREAEAVLVASYLAIRDRTGERSLLTRNALERLVVLYDAWGKPEKAAEYRALWVEARGSP